MAAELELFKGVASGVVGELIERSEILFYDKAGIVIVKQGDGERRLLRRARRVRAGRATPRGRHRSRAGLPASRGVFRRGGPARRCAAHRERPDGGEVRGGEDLPGGLPRAVRSPSGGRTARERGDGGAPQGGRARDRRAVEPAAALGAGLRAGRCAVGDGPRVVRQVRPLRAGVRGSARRQPPGAPRHAAGQIPGAECVPALRRSPVHVLVPDGRHQSAPGGRDLRALRSLRRLRRVRHRLPVRQYRDDRDRAFRRAHRRASRPSSAINSSSGPIPPPRPHRRAACCSACSARRPRRRGAAKWRRTRPIPSRRAIRSSAICATACRSWAASTPARPEPRCASTRAPFCRRPARSASARGSTKRGAWSKRERRRRRAGAGARPSSAMRALRRGALPVAAALVLVAGAPCSPRPALGAAPRRHRQRRADACRHAPRRRLRPARRRVRLFSLHLVRPFSLLPLLRPFRSARRAARPDAQLARRPSGHSARCVVLPLWWHVARGAGGLLELGLLAVAALVVLSGLVGALLQYAMPQAMLHSIEREVRVRDVLSRQRELFVEAEESILGREALAEVYVHSVRPIVQGDTPRRLLLEALLRGQDAGALVARPRPGLSATRSMPAMRRGSGAWSSWPSRRRGSTSISSSCRLRPAGWSCMT